MVTNLQENEVRRVTWWLEPGAFFFDFEKKGQDFVLTIIKTDDLLNQGSYNTLLTTIIGDNKEIIEPFRLALRHFASQTYEINQWPYSLDKNQIQNL